MDPFSIFGCIYMFTPSANLAKSASGYCVNHVSEWGRGTVFTGVKFFHFTNHFL